MKFLSSRQKKSTKQNNINYVNDTTVIIHFIYRQRLRSIQIFQIQSSSFLIFFISSKSLLKDFTSFKSISIHQPSIKMLTRSNPTCSDKKTKKQIIHEETTIV